MTTHRLPHLAVASPRPVLVVSADPDLSQLLVFLLHAHHLPTVLAAAPTPSGARAPSPGLVLLDLTDRLAYLSTVMGTTPADSPLPCIVLTRPEGMAAAWAQVPQAAAYLPVPVSPRALVTVVRQFVVAGPTGTVRWVARLTE